MQQFDVITTEMQFIDNESEEKYKNVVILPPSILVHYYFWIYISKTENLIHYSTWVLNFNNFPITLIMPFCSDEVIIICFQVLSSRRHLSTKCKQWKERQVWWLIHQPRRNATRITKTGLLWYTIRKRNFGRRGYEADGGTKTLYMPWTEHYDPLQYIASTQVWRGIVFSYHN
jgi:hypothetical protein